MPNQPTNTLALSIQQVKDLAQTLRTRTHPEEQSNATTLEGVAASLQAALTVVNALAYKNEKDVANPMNTQSGKAITRNGPTSPPANPQQK